MITIRRILVSALNCAAGVLVIAFAAQPDVNPAQRPAPTLTTPSTPTSPPDEEGFIRRWLLLEPVAANGLTESAVRAALSKEPLFSQSMEIPHNGDRITFEGSDLTWHAVDSNRYNVNLYHFAYAMGKPTSNVLFWAVTVVDCPYELKNVRLAIGSNAASVWWVNGKEVIGI